MAYLQLIRGKRETTFGEARFRAIAPLVELDQVPKAQRFPRLLPDGSRAWSATQIAAWCAKENGRCVAHGSALARRIQTGREGRSGTRSSRRQGLLSFLWPASRRGSFRGLPASCMAAERPRNSSIDFAES